MTGAVISDIHIRQPEDDGYSLLLSFLSKAEVKESSTWYFLGDIFDLMVGNHLEYVELFPEFFECVGDFLNGGGHIYFLEGNHDFHLDILFNRYFKTHSIRSENFHYHQKAFEQKLWGQNFYFCHGDDIQVKDFGYKTLKFILRNPLSRFIINKIMTFSILQKIGVLMSGNSRKYNVKKFEDNSGQKFIKDKFRKLAQNFSRKKDYDFLICGHSHIMDDFVTKEGMRYINIGFPPRSQKYLLIRELETTLKPLT